MLQDGDPRIAVAFAESLSRGITTLKLIIFHVGNSPYPASRPFPLFLLPVNILSLCPSSHYRITSFLRMLLADNLFITVWCVRHFLRYLCYVSRNIHRDEKGSKVNGHPFLLVTAPPSIQPSIYRRINIIRYQLHCTVIITNMWNTYCKNINSHRLLRYVRSYVIAAYCESLTCDSATAENKCWHYFLIIIRYNYRELTRRNCIKEMLHIATPPVGLLYVSSFRMAEECNWLAVYLPRSNLGISRVVTGQPVTEGWNERGRELSLCNCSSRIIKIVKNSSMFIDHWFIRVLLQKEKEQVNGEEGNVQLLLMIKY